MSDVGPTDPHQRSRADDEPELDRDPPEARDPIHVGRRSTPIDSGRSRGSPRSLFTRLDASALQAEAVRLTPAKRVRLLEAIVEEHDNQVPVPAGVATEAENTSVRLARELANAGADGLVIPPADRTDSSVKARTLFRGCCGAPPGPSAASDSE